MSIKSFVAIAVLSIAPLSAQLAAPNSVGVAIGHFHLNARDIEAQQFSYDRIAANGINVVAQAAVRIDPQARTVGLTDGTTLTYDRLVLSPGIDLRYETMPGYDETAALKMPPTPMMGRRPPVIRARARMTSVLRAVRGRPLAPPSSAKNAWSG